MGLTCLVDPLFEPPFCSGSRIWAHLRRCGGRHRAASPARRAVCTAHRQSSDLEHLIEIPQRQARPRGRGIANRELVQPQNGIVLSDGRGCRPRSFMTRCSLSTTESGLSVPSAPADSGMLSSRRPEPRSHPAATRGCRKSPDFRALDDAVVVGGGRAIKFAGPASRRCVPRWR